MTNWLIGTGIAAALVVAFGRWCVGILHAALSVRRWRGLIRQGLKEIVTAGDDDFERRGLTFSGVRVQYEQTWNERAEGIERHIFSLGWYGRDTECEQVIIDWQRQVQEEIRWLESRWNAYVRNMHLEMVAHKLPDRPPM